MGKRYGAIYYLFMEFRNNDHRYVLSDSSDELKTFTITSCLKEFLKQKKRHFGYKKVRATDISPVQ
jgi:hypothetical protein